ncbi:hypothetical protein ICE98_02383 [Lactococcus lactis]|nr:hypothetical protein [Lactococcus lactis]
MSKKSPQLRFEGFTDDWEERKLGKVLKKDTLKNKDLEFHYKDIISVAQMKKATVVRDSSDSYMTTYNKIRFGNIAFEGHANKEFPNGRFVLNDFRDGIVSHIYDVYSFIEKSDSNFMKKYINNPIVMRKILINSTSNARMMNSLNSKEFLKQNLILPTFEEQAKIGSFLKQLDITITLHQRKLDLLKEQKKGYLQKMFPKNGAKVPELRFAGFADDWEERKLRDLLNKNSEKNKNLSVINVESVSNKTGFTKQTDQFEDYSVASADLSNYYVIREKQFAYNPSRINVGSIAYKDLGDEISVVSPLYVSFSTKKVLNDGFLWNWFKTASFDAQRQRLSEGGVRDTLSFNQLSEMNTMFPTYPEQEKIGSFFQQLDETIALHQCKLDLLKEQKKGFLQKMFV